MLLEIYEGSLFLRYNNKVRSSDYLFHEWCGVSSSFIAADISTERLPRAQVFCVPGAIQVWPKEETQERHRKKSLLCSHVLERLSLYTERGSHRRGDQGSWLSQAGGEQRERGPMGRCFSWVVRMEYIRKGM